MQTFESVTANGAFLQILDALSTAKEMAPRGLKTREITNCMVQISDPTRCVVTVPARKMSRRYLAAEWLWYFFGMPGPQSADMIAHYAPFWDKIRNPDGSVNSNYGYYLFNDDRNSCNGNPECESQLDWVVKQLLSDSDTRQACMNINQPYHKWLPHCKDFPCTFYLAFLIRDNKLDMTVSMRSNDVVLGFCNDVFQFAQIHQLVHQRLKNEGSSVELGTYTHHALSMHIYERHYPMMEEILSMPSLSGVVNVGNWGVPFDMPRSDLVNLYIMEEACRKQVHGTDPDKYMIQPEYVALTDYGKSLIRELIPK